VLDCGILEGASGVKYARCGLKNCIWQGGEGAGIKLTEKREGEKKKKEWRSNHSVGEVRKRLRGK